MTRRVPIVLALLLLAACETERPLTAPEVAEPSAILIDGTTDGNSHLYFLPPVVDNNAPFVGPADPSLHPRVEICEWAGDKCVEVVEGGVEFTYTTASGPGGIVVEVFDDHYQVDWDTQLPGVELGMLFRARIVLVNLELGSVDLQIAENGREVKNLDEDFAIGLVDNRTVALRFRIEEGAVEEAETEAEGELCADELDCDVEIIDGEEGGTATVENPTAGPDGTPTNASQVTIQPNDAFDANGDPVSDFTVTLQHVSEPPSEDLIPAQQIPFFIDLTAEDAEGLPVFFQNGAEIILCQPPDLGNEEVEAPLFIHDDYHHSLRMFRVHDGVTELLETGFEHGGFCPSGLHGGLSTILTGSFSGFGATLPTAAHLSTAVVPDGTVGEPTVIDIQAMVETAEGPLEQLFGGDSVVVTVFGANSATPAVTDNLDGTYTTQYTPTAAGLDTVDIRIFDLDSAALVPIDGSPFESVVTVPAADLVVSSVGPVSLEGSAASFDYTVSNIGGPAADYPDNSTWDVAVYLSTDAVFDESDEHLSSMYSAWSYPVDTEFSVPFSESGTLPAATTAGEYHLIVVTDAFPGQSPNFYPGVAESDESNNWTASPPFTVIEGAWAATGSLSGTLRDHTSTLLDNGNVLIVAGQGTGADAELYHPTTGTFTTLTPVYAHGYLPTATKLADGRVLIVGGSTAPTSAEIYDPTVGALGTFTATASTNEDRSVHTATLLADGRVLVAGGQNPGANALAEIYDPGTGTFTATGSMNDARFGHSATLLQDGKVLIVGGSDPGCLASAELYDPVAGAFSVTGGLPYGACGALHNTSPLLADGTVLVTAGGGTAAQLYDPALGTFGATGSMATPHGSGVATLLADGRVLVTGGFTATGPVTTDGAEIYDPVRGLFGPAATMTSPRQEHRATLLPDGRVLLTGGGNGETELASAELFTPGL